MECKLHVRSTSAVNHYLEERAAQMQNMPPQDKKTFLFSQNCGRLHHKVARSPKKKNILFFHVVNLRKRDDIIIIQ